MIVTVPSEPLRDGYLFIRFEACIKDNNSENTTTLKPVVDVAKQTIAYLTCRVKSRIPNDTRRIFLGTLNYSIDRRPFCAPLILSNVKIEDADYRQIVDCQFNCYIHGNEFKK
jgi:hypothetical protein